MVGLTFKLDKTAGGGMVTVVINGVKQIHRITIDPEVVSEDDVEMLEDLIVEAINDAHRKLAGLSRRVSPTPCCQRGVVGR
jgi:DNA-binding YbaB/EbfC family protein